MMPPVALSRQILKPVEAGSKSFKTSERRYNMELGLHNTHDRSHGLLYCLLNHSPPRRVVEPTRVPRKDVDIGLFHWEGLLKTTEGSAYECAPTTGRSSSSSEGGQERPKSEARAATYSAPRGEAKMAA
jgi:hypothetical protein